MSKPIIVALDTKSESQATNLARSLDPSLCRLKVGKALFTAAGPGMVSKLHHLGFEVFLDLKFHDIPDQVERAVQAAAELGVWMLTVHASGGQKMLQAAVGGAKGTRTKVVAVTVLTSLDQSDLDSMGVSRPLEEQVGWLAKIAKGAGLDGVVCSAREAKALRQQHGAEFSLVTPGIRPADTSDDQKRTLTPSEALDQGSDYLVIGRPITASCDPLLSLKAIHRTLNLEN